MLLKTAISCNVIIACYSGDIVYYLNQIKQFLLLFKLTRLDPDIEFLKGNAFNCKGAPFFVLKLSL